MAKNTLKTRHMNGMIAAILMASAIPLASLAIINYNSNIDYLEQTTKGKIETEVARASKLVRNLEDSKRLKVEQAASFTKELKADNPKLQELILSLVKNDPSFMGYSITDSEGKELTNYKIEKSLDDSGLASIRNNGSQVVNSRSVITVRSLMDENRFIEMKFNAAPQISAITEQPGIRMKLIGQGDVSYSYMVKNGEDEDYLWSLRSATLASAPFIEKTGDYNHREVTRRFGAIKTLDSGTTVMGSINAEYQEEQYKTERNRLLMWLTLATSMISLAIIPRARAMAENLNELRHLAASMLVGSIDRVKSSDDIAKSTSWIERIKEARSHVNFKTWGELKPLAEALTKQGDSLIKVIDTRNKMAEAEINRANKRSNLSNMT